MGSKVWALELNVSLLSLPFNGQSRSQEQGGERDLSLRWKELWDVMPCGSVAHSVPLICRHLEGWLLSAPLAQVPGQL